MFKKIILSSIAVILLSSVSFSWAERAMAAYPESYTVSSSEPAKAEIVTTASVRSEGLGTAAATPYYPTIFYKEYFYRDNNTQPIRDFRYFGIKTFKPNVERSNKVYRDFRDIPK